MTPYLSDADCTLYHGDALAWAAGLFEGEGCISTSSGGSGIVAHLSSTDRDVVERFGMIADVGSITECRRTASWKPHWKTQWLWTASGADAERAIRSLLPLLGKRRTARALEVFAQRAAFVEDATRERVCPGCGITFRPRMSPRARHQTHCTMDCYDRQRAREQLKHKPEDAIRERECPSCGDIFRPVYSRAAARKRFCSQRCRARAHRKAKTCST